MLPEHRQGALQASLRIAEGENNKSGRCSFCDALNEVSGTTRDALIAAAAGTIGAAKLSRILRSYDLDVAERQIRKHKSEEHGS